MVLDLRAEILCDLGPVISGSIRDDHIQGQGLIYTTGELVIAGLITPSHGTEVNLAYVTPDGSTAARFPRGPFRVTRAFANPLTNQTELTIANELAYQKGKGGGTVNSALVDALNGREPKEASALDLREAFALIASRCGITTGELGSWTLPKQLEALDSSDYIETMSDILASVGRFGYLDADNVLQVQSYEDLDLTGPVMTFDQVLDLNLNSGGLDFTETPVGSGEAQQVGDETGSGIAYTAGYQVQESNYGAFTSSWDSSSLETTTSVKVTFYNGSSESFPVTESVLTSEQTAEPDNRVISRTTSTTQNLVKVNSQVVQDYINKGLRLNALNQNGNSLIQTGRNLASTTVTTSKYDSYTFIEIPAPPVSEEQQAQIDQEIESAISTLQDTDNPVSETLRIQLLPNLPTYRLIREELTEEMSHVEALGRIGITDYTKFGELPSAVGRKQVVQIDYMYSDTAVKEVRRVFVAYGLTQMGQQAIAAAANSLRKDNPESLLYFSPLLSQFFSLVLEDFVITVRDDLGDGNKSEVPSYLAPYEASDVVIQGGSRIQVGEEESTPRANNATSFSVPFLPDDIVNDDGTVTKGDAETAAAGYAEQQNLLLLGHRLGMQVTTGLGYLPTSPLSAFHLSSNDLSATYRTNGTSWAFDANSCIVSTDALYWGLSGEDVNGPRWTPVAPGTTALPVTPAVVDNGAQSPVNSTALEEAVDVSDTAAVAALISSLPTDEVEVFEQELTPTALATAYKIIRETALQVVLQLEPKVVPLGINRSLGDAELQLRCQLEAVQAIGIQVRLQLESEERRLLAETFSNGIGLGGNLS